MKVADRLQNLPAYAFARLGTRIRELTQEMLKQAKKVMPLTLMMACGKDRFAKFFKKTFSRT